MVKLRNWEKGVKESGGPGIENSKKKEVEKIWKLGNEEAGKQLAKSTWRLGNY